MRLQKRIESCIMESLQLYIIIAALFCFPIHILCKSHLLEELLCCNKTRSLLNTAVRSLGLTINFRTFLLSPKQRIVHYHTSHFCIHKSFSCIVEVVSQTVKKIRDQYHTIFCHKSWNSCQSEKFNESQKK